MDNKKEYFAFISHSHKDKKWAKWLQHKLEHYKLPSNLNGRSDLPKEIRPVFRDITELASGKLKEEIEKNLNASKYLIVVCSPNAAKSDYVNEEIKRFIEWGRTDHIIPFIIEGVPYASELSQVTDKAKECFPPSLVELRKKPDNELLGINISDLGRDAAAVKVVAQMFGLKFDALWMRYAREQKKKRNWLIAASLMIILVMAGVMGWIWYQNVNLKNAISRVTAGIAESLTEKGDSYSAERVALSALTRSYTLEAEHALRKAFYTAEGSVFQPDYHSFISYVTYNEEQGVVLVKTTNDYSFYPTYYLFDIEGRLLLKDLYSVGHFAFFSPCGGMLVKQYEREFVVYEFENSKTLSLEKIGYFKGHKIIFSDDEKLIATLEYGNNRNIIRIWNNTNNTWYYCDSIINNNNDNNQYKWIDIACNNDGNMIVVIDNDYRLLIYEKQTLNWVCADTLLFASYYNIQRYPEAVLDFDANNQLLVFVKDNNDDWKSLKKIVWSYNNGVFKPQVVIDTCAYISEIESKSNDTIVIKKDWIVRVCNKGYYNNSIYFGRPTGVEYEHCERIKVSDDKVCSASFSIDNKHIISTSGDGKIRIWSEYNNLWLCEDTIKVSNYPVGYATFSLGGDSIAFMSNGTIYIAEKSDNKWMLIDSIEQVAYQYHRCNYDNPTIIMKNDSVYFGGTIITKNNGEWGSVSQYVHVDCFPSVTPRYFYLYNKHYYPTNSAHSYYIDNCGTFVRIVDTKTGYCVVQFDADVRNRINSVYFSSDDEKIIAAFDDGTIRIWDFPPLQDLIDQTRERFKDRPLTPEERHQYYLE